MKQASAALIAILDGNTNFLMSDCWTFALKNGVTKAEIREVLLQVAIYCGVPAGVDSFRIAREAFNELEKQQP